MHSAANCLKPCSAIGPEQGSRFVTVSKDNMVHTPHTHCLPSSQMEKPSIRVGGGP